MASFNKVMLLGNLCADVELRNVGDTVVTDLRMAVNDRVKKGGEYVDETTYVDVTFWARTAEIASEYLSKGSPLLIEGKLKQDTWTDKTSGENRSKLKIAGDRLVLLGKGGGEGGGSKRAPAATVDASSIPF